MFLAQNFFQITIICDKSVLEHLVNNIRKFNPVNYTVEDINTAKGDRETVPGARVQLLCTRNEYTKIMEYIQQYYVKDYGAVMYRTEVFMAM
jgi:hypothetical protein